MTRSFRAVVVCALPIVMAAVVLGARAVSAGAQNQADLDKRFLDAWVQQRRIDLGVQASGARVVIVKFNDWMCPGCKAWYQMFKPVLAKYQTPAGAIKYVEKDFPWNAQCNASIQQTIPGHESACAAAVAVRLAAEKGKRDAMAEWLYANQPQTPADRLTMLDRVRAKAGELLGIKDFASAYTLKVVDVRKDVSDGMAVQVRSTPTYFINGIRATGPDGGMIPIHYVELAIQHELAKKTP